MLKPLIAVSAALALTGTTFAQEQSASKPAVFIASQADASNAQSAVTLSAADAQAVSQLLSECPGIQAVAKEIEADYTLRLSAQDGSKNQLQVLNASGVIVASGLAGDNKSAVKDACNIVLSDFNHNGRATSPVLDSDAATVPVPALVSPATAAAAPAKVALPAEPVPAGFVVVSAPAAIPAPTAAPLAAPPAPPAAPKTINATSSSQLPPVVPGAGNIHGATVSTGDTSGYQAQQPAQQETLSLGEIARRNRAAKAVARQQEQQAQNQPADSPAPSAAPHQ